jgi:hypothetical protein
MSKILWYTVTLKFNNRAAGLELEINDNPKLYSYRFVITFKNFLLIGVEFKLQRLYDFSVYSHSFKL